ncbi:MAG: hypothetical protein KY397_06050 [Gemmatimonadetes bacterium]|nr:hypothetical protein [Gemmatimonadota bacterium]
MTQSPSWPRRRAGSTLGRVQEAGHDSDGQRDDRDDQPPGGLLEALTPKPERGAARQGKPDEQARGDP